MKIGDKVKTKDGVGKIIQIKEGKGFKYVVLESRLIYDVKEVELFKEKKKKIEKQEE